MSRIMLAAGGTGGHVMPALAVAAALRERGVEVLWLGTKGGLEAQLVPRAGYEFATTGVTALRGGGLRRTLTMPLRLGLAMLKAWWLMWRRRPDGVLGMGGFASAPGALVAALCGRALVVHEQNSIAGLTNRHLARLVVRNARRGQVGRVLSGYPTVSGIPESLWVGNPVRQEIIDLPPPAERLGKRDAGAPLRVLIVGGSLGAAVFNRHMPTLISRAMAGEGNANGGSTAPSPRFEIWHQCGPASPCEVGTRYHAAGVTSEVVEFIDDMARAWEWCDLAVCRAGAMTVAEVCAAGVAAILVPYPHAAGDHQRGNAEFLHLRGAARLVGQEAFVRGDWLRELHNLRRDCSRRIEMAEAARTLARPDAAAAVADVCMEAIGA